MAFEIFPPAVQQPMFALAYDALLRAIVTGALAPGQRVNEAEIARQMQISRGPVREAIQRLEQAGLLASVPRRGSIVVSLKPEDIEEVYTLRADLEVRAIQRATRRLSDSDMAELERLMHAMQTAGDAGDLPGLLDADIEFHRDIVSAAGWPQLERMWESLHPRTLTLYTIRTLVDWAPNWHADRHTPVLEALRARDPHRAQEAIRQHIIGVGSELARLAGWSEGFADSGEQDIQGKRSVG